MLQGPYFSSALQLGVEDGQQNYTPNLTVMCSIAQFVTARKLYIFFFFLNVFILRGKKILHANRSHFSQHPVNEQVNILLLQSIKLFKTLFEAARSRLLMFGFPYALLLTRDLKRKRCHWHSGQTCAVSSH